MADYYPKEKGVIRRDRAGEFRDFMAKELMMEALGLIPVAGMAGKFGKGRRAVEEYTSQVKSLGRQGLERESAKFKKDLLSGKVDAIGNKPTELSKASHAKYGPVYTDAGIESRMGTPGVSASSYGGVMNLKDWTPVAVDRLYSEIKKNDKIYDKFVKGFKDLLKAKHKIGRPTWKEKLNLGIPYKERLTKAKSFLKSIVPDSRSYTSGYHKHGDLNIKGVQEAFLKPAAKQARSELAKQFPKVPR